MLMQANKGRSKITSGIQIIFFHGNHWIVVSNVSSPSEIIIYDSLHVSIAEEVKEIVLSLFSYDDGTSLLLAPMQKQELWIQHL